MKRALTIAVLGLGEAGGTIARDLVAGGADVRSYDPVVEAPPGCDSSSSEADAVHTADVVLSVNTARSARQALVNALPTLGADAIWADLNTAEPQLKRDLTALIPGAAGGFVDVAIMAPVPRAGLRTSLLCSGSAAPRFADMLRPFGTNIDVLDEPAGAAAERKLLRSVFYKGMAAAVVESLDAAKALNLEDWLRDNITEELTNADHTTVTRMVEGTHRHARRRTDEMAAAGAMLRDLGLDSDITRATHQLLSKLDTSA
ncbi:MAG: NAD(P)-dependent oxidoreductase [Gordonia sp.]|nr:NAD(P)-dependent oxidoreductase [Gordonia sp. (in: high G+C Gram-positive bacteria)]